MNIATPKFGVGASALRKEDAPLITGRGQYTDDIHKDGELHAYVLRSPYAAAAFTITSTEEAAKAEGVSLVLTAADIAHIGPVKCQGRATQPDGTVHEVREQPVLCDGRVHFVGDAIAFVVADTATQARDAAELIEVDWEMGEAVSDTAAALQDGAPLVWPELGTNKVYTYRIGDAAASDEAFARAAHVSEISFTNNRLISNYMEPRAAIGEWDAGKERYVLTSGSQGVHGLRDTIARDNFGVARDKVRVITRDVGGGFGTKAFNYREYPLVLEAAKRLGKPVKWVGDRTEHFLSDAHGRDNVVHCQHGDGRRRPVPRLQGRPHGRTWAPISRSSAPIIPDDRRDHDDRPLRHRDHRRHGDRRLHQHGARRRLSRRRPAGGRLS